MLTPWEPRLGGGSVETRYRNAYDVCYGDDIVHALWKLWDKCKEMVAGSSPARGAIWE